MGVAATGQRAALNRAEKPQFYVQSSGDFFNVYILSNKLLKTPWLSFRLGPVPSATCGGGPGGEGGGRGRCGGAVAAAAARTEGGSGGA